MLTLPAKTDMTMKEPLLGKTLDELREVAASVGLPPFTAKQIADWLYKKHIHSIDEMSNISLKGRAALAARYDIGCVPPVRAAQSADGTRKYLFPDTLRLLSGWLPYGLPLLHDRTARMER